MAGQQMASTGECDSAEDCCKPAGQAPSTTCVSGALLQFWARRELLSGALKSAQHLPVRAANRRTLLASARLASQVAPCSLQEVLPATPQASSQVERSEGSWQADKRHVNSSSIRPPSPSESTALTATPHSRHDESHSTERVHMLHKSATVGPTWLLLDCEADGPRPFQAEAPGPAAARGLPAAQEVPRPPALNASENAGQGGAANTQPEVHRGQHHDTSTTPLPRAPSDLSLALGVRAWRALSVRRLSGTRRRRPRQQHWEGHHRFLRSCLVVVTASNSVCVAEAWGTSLRNLQLIRQSPSPAAPYPVSGP